jgi:tetrahydromethanopterin S-methyltransferase subunit G
MACRGCRNQTITLKKGANEMPQIDPSQALSQFVGSLPTFIAVLLAWLTASARASDLKSSLEGKINDKFETLNTRIDATNKTVENKFEVLNQKIEGTNKTVQAQFEILKQNIDATNKTIQAQFEMLNIRIDATDRKIDHTRELLSQKIESSDAKVDHARDLLREEFLRVEEVMDARIKHLEEKN